MAVVTMSLSPQMIGHDQATPGTFTFHWMFLSLPHSAGNCFSAVRPSPAGPRNCGQSLAEEYVPANEQMIVKDATTSSRRLVEIILKSGFINLTLALLFGCSNTPMF